MPFPVPDVVSGETLVLRGIQSQDYVAGSTGWRIQRDGTAEFNGVTVKGTLKVSDPDGSYVWIYDDPTSNGAFIEIRPADVAGHTIEAGYIRGTYGDTGITPGLTLVSPKIDDGPQSKLALESTDVFCSIAMTGDHIGLAGVDATTSVNESLVNLTNDGYVIVWASTEVNILGPLFESGILFDNYTTQITGPTSVDGLPVRTSAGTKSFIGGVTAPVSTSYSTEVALSAWDSTVSDTYIAFRDGYLYQLDLKIQSYTASTGAGRGIIRVRGTVNSTSSSLLGYFLVDTLGSSLVVTKTLSTTVKNVSGGDLNRSLGITVQANNNGNFGLYGDASGLDSTIDVTCLGPVTHAKLLKKAAQAYSIT